MANFGVMKAWIQLLVQNELVPADIGTLLNMADLEEVEDYQWNRLKAEISVNSSAALTGLAVTVTQGSTIVSRNSGAFFPVIAAPNFQWVVTISGQAFAPLPVASVSANTITLAAAYPAPNNNAATASLFPLWYSASNSVTVLQEVLGVRQQRALRQTTHEQINQFDAYRAQIASPSQQWAPGGRDVNDAAQFELWPIETTANAYIVYGVKGHVDMVADASLPAVPSNVVAAKATAKACEAIFALRGDARWANMRDYYQGRYEEARERARLTDAQQFGVLNNIQDKYRSQAGGVGTPGFDIVMNTDVWPYG